MLVILFDFILNHLPTSGEVDEWEGWGNTVFVCGPFRLVRVSFTRTGRVLRQAMANNSTLWSCAV